MVRTVREDVAKTYYVARKTGANRRRCSTVAEAGPQSLRDMRRKHELDAVDNLDCAGVEESGTQENMHASFVSNLKLHYVIH